MCEARLKTRFNAPRTTYNALRYTTRLLQFGSRKDAERDGAATALVVPNPADRRKADRAARPRGQPFQRSPQHPSFPLSQAAAAACLRPRCTMNVKD